MKKKLTIVFFALCLIANILCLVPDVKKTVQAEEDNSELSLSVNWQGFSYIGKYEGQTKNGVPTGKGKYEGDSTDGNGSKMTITYDGEWKKGKFYGKGRLEDTARALIYEGDFLEGMLNGNVKVFSNTGKLSYTLVNYKADIPYNFSWNCDAEGKCIDYDCYYQGISVRQIRQESREIAYTELVYNAEDNLYRKVKLQCKVESQRDVEGTSLRREITVSDKNRNRYFLQYDLAYDSIATNYMPFLNEGQELTVYGYFSGLQYPSEDQHILYPKILALFAETKDDNDFFAKNLDFKYNSFLNYPYLYKDKKIELEGTIKGIYKLTEKQILFLVESGNYSDGKKDLYVCKVKKKPIAPDQLPLLGETVTFSGTLQLLRKFDKNEELNIFIPLIGDAKIIER